MNKPKLICPHCGEEMNQHAMKIDYNVDDPALSQRTRQVAARLNILSTDDTDFMTSV